MTDRNKFEEMLDRLVNEDQAGAEELFHEIVVEKSREIYESLLEDDLEIEEAEKDEDEEEVEEAAEEDDEEEDEVSEDFDLDEFEVEADDDMMSGEMGDDLLKGIEDGDEDEDPMDDEDAEDMEDRVEDLETALEELEKEFRELMDKEEGNEDEEPMGDDEGEEEPEEESFEFEAEEKDEEEDEVEESQDELDLMREYIEKIGAPKMGETGTDGTKSAVASKNDMGGTAGNLNQSGTEAGVEANKGNLKGSALSDQNPKEENFNQVNVPGGKAGKSMKSAGKPKMGDTGTNGTKSTIGQ